MNLILYSDNRQTQIEANVTFEEGSVLLCDPGLDFCSSRLFNLMQLDGTLDSSGIWKPIFNVDKAPDFGSNRYGLSFRSAYRYFLYDDLEFTFQSSFIINHIADPDKKRYTEAWVTYYPSADFVLSYLSGDFLVTSDGISMLPQVELRVIQSVDFPSSASAYWNNFLLDDLTVHHSSDSIVMYAGPFIAIYDYNAGLEEWEEAFVYEFGGTILGADILNGLVIVCHSTDQLTYIEKSGTWSIINTYDDPLDRYGRIIFHSEDEFIVVSTSTIPARFYVSTRAESFNYYSYDTSWSPFYPVQSVRRGYVWDDQSWSWAGGPPYSYPTYGNLSSGYVGYSNDFKSIYFTNREYVGFGAEFQELDNGVFYGYGYLDYDEPEGKTMNLPSGTNHWAHHKFLVGFSHDTMGSGVYYCYKDTEIIRLYDYVPATHKPWSARLIPLIAPNISIINGGDGTFKVVEIIVNEYDTTSPALGVLKVTTTKELVSLSDFYLPTPPANTSYKFLLSEDNVTYYKWGGSSWTAESDVTNGNTYAEFVAGCQDGWDFAAGKYTVYIKIAMYTSDALVTPGFNWTDSYISLTTISTTNNTFLCDDSKIKIEFISDTETRFTSLMEPNVAVNALVGIVAPPYNVDYED